MVQIAQPEIVFKRAFKSPTPWRQIARLGLRFWPALVLPLAALNMLVLVFTSSAAAQGCAMCYQSAAASGVIGRTALRHGILILLVPSISIFFGILALIYRRRHCAHQSHV